MPNQRHHHAVERINDQHINLQRDVGHTWSGELKVCAVAAAWPIAEFDHEARLCAASGIAISYPDLNQIIGVTHLAQGPLKIGAVGGAEIKILSVLAAAGNYKVQLVIRDMQSRLI